MNFDITQRIKMLIGDLVLGQITQQNELDKLKAELESIKGKTEVGKQSDSEKN